MRFSGLTLVPALIVSLLTGCATTESGRRIDASASDAFVEGVATRQDIESRMGKPTSIATNSNGQTVLVYSHVVGHGNGLTGKASATATMATFVLGKDGKLLSKTTTTVDSQSRQ